ncbi:hypothetical protein AK812_SmicGene14274 [Symbiodinium microadriaticum]|uniref:Uncharacterized protein n=1 Tax=Symbiodinium microadriaticum TaxID=2951 RepID=A0A1Q9E5X7_SYMMI|nr:hypothetical protein AK812_SmicGene14274 [Symbiodinium microadriaticum]
MSVFQLVEATAEMNGAKAECEQKEPVTLPVLVSTAVFMTLGCYKFIVAFERLKWRKSGCSIEMVPKLPTVLLLTACLHSGSLPLCEDCDGSDVSELLQLSRTAPKEAMDLEQLAQKIAKEKASTGFLAFYMVKVFLDSALWMLEKQFTGLIEVADKAGQDLQELFSSAKEGPEEVYQEASDLLKELFSRVRSELFSGSSHVPTVFRMFGLRRSAEAYTSSVKQASDILDDLFKACDVGSYAAGSLEDSLATCRGKSSEMKDVLPKLMRSFLDTLADNIAWAVYNKDALKAYADQHLDYTVGIVQRVCTSVHGAVLALADGASSDAQVSTTR